MERLFNAIELPAHQYTLCWKWGFDSTTTLFFKQRREEHFEDEEEISDNESDDGGARDDNDGNCNAIVEKRLSKSREEVFCVFFVPLKVIRNSDQVVVWKNPTPNSPRFCRPLRIHFVKETKEVIQAAEENVLNQISYLPDIIFNGATVNNSFRLTMIDGKVCIHD